MLTTTLRAALRARSRVVAFALFLPLASGHPEDVYRSFRLRASQMLLGFGYAVSRAARSVSVIAP